MPKCLLFFIGLIGISYLPNKLIANTNALTDKVIIHLNQSFYVNGDRIWYKIYLPTTYKSIDLPIKVALIGSNGKAIQEGYINTNGHTFIDGQIKIPLDLSSGTYHLVAYGTHNRTKDFLRIAEIFIPIYNDLQRDLKITPPDKQIPIKKELPFKQALDLSIHLTNTHFTTRQKINATIDIVDKNGQPVQANLSIAIRDVSLTQPAITNGQTVWAIRPGVATFPHILDTTIFIKGKASTLADKTKKLPILSAYSSMDRQFYYAKTGEAGDFTLNLPDFNTNTPIQFINFQQGAINVQLTNQLPISRNPILIVNKAVLNYLEWSRKRKKIVQLFKTSEDLILENVVAEKIKTLSPDRQFILSTYEHFDSMYDLCKEVSTPLKFRKNKDGSIYAKMFNPARGVRKFYTANPIFIIDGKVTRDPEFVNQIDMYQVEKIDLYFEKEKLERLFGPMGQGGVVFIKTLIPNIQIPSAEENTIFLINGFYPKAHNNPSNANLPLVNMPIFQPSQYWIGDQTTNEQGKTGFSFLQTDDLGAFEIEVVAQDAAGNIGVLKRIYFVEQ